MRVRLVPLVLVVTMILEIVVFIVVGNAIGFGLAVLALLALSLIGGVLLKREGVRAWTRFQSVVSAGERPGDQVIRSLVGMLGALLLLIPGFVTALVGAALFLPPIRALAGKGVAGLAGRRLPSAAMSDLFGPRQVRVKVGKPTPTGPGTPSAPVEIVEGEIVDPR